MLCYYGDENVNKVNGRCIKQQVKKQNGCQNIRHEGKNTGTVK